MTVDEWSSREEEEDQCIIKVMEHKTTGAFGPAVIVVSHEVALLMEGYFLHIRGKILPQNSLYEKRFFLTNTGNEYGKICECMRDVAESFGLSVPNPGLQRKVLASEAYKSQDNIVVRKMQKHMCHSAATCESYYQHADNESAINTKKAIEKLTKARHFTAEESKAVLSEYPLTEEATPSLAICKVICQKHNLQKTKQLQDHWRSCKKVYKASDL